MKANKIYGIPVGSVTQFMVPVKRYLQDLARLGLEEPALVLANVLHVSTLEDAARLIPRPLSIRSRGLLPTQDGIRHRIILEQTREGYPDLPSDPTGWTNQQGKEELRRRLCDFVLGLSSIGGALFPDLGAIIRSADTSRRDRTSLSPDEYQRGMRQLVEQLGRQEVEVRADGLRGMFDRLLAPLCDARRETLTFTPFMVWAQREGIQLPITVLGSWLTAKWYYLDHGQDIERAIKSLHKLQ
jgi:hypothetical protein